MTIQKENEQDTLESNLLTSLEQATCQQVASRQAPHSQRALALLALNEKCTQAQAAEQAGLSPGQVKYWVARFRKLRLGIFPDTLLDELDTKAEEARVELVIEIEREPQAVTEEADSAEGKTEDTKAKKGKKAVKTKKGKKDKKGKKVEKPVKKKAAKKETRAKKKKAEKIGKPTKKKKVEKKKTDESKKKTKKAKKKKTGKKTKK